MLYELSIIKTENRHKAIAIVTQRRSPVGLLTLNVVLRALQNRQSKQAGRHAVMQPVQAEPHTAAEA
jgi:hypothetical protein